MGYYTSFNLSVVNETSFTENQLKEVSSKLARRLDEDDEYPFHKNVLNPFEWISYDTRKWYEHEEDMMQFSREYPDMIFLLEGWGEDCDDVWRKYFKDGKIKICNRHYFWDEAPEWALRG